MHTAALFGEIVKHDAEHYGSLFFFLVSPAFLCVSSLKYSLLIYVTQLGWEIPKDQVRHNWTKMVEAVQGVQRSSVNCCLFFFLSNSTFQITSGASTGATGRNCAIRRSST